MHSEDSVVYADCDWEIVEDVCVVLPNHSVPVLGLAFHIEAIILRNGSSLMVPSNHRDPLRVFYLQQAQQGDDFDTVGSPVDVIPQEQVAGVGQFPTHFEYLQEIIELPMHVPHQADGGVDSAHILLIDQDVLEPVAEDADRLLFQQLAIQSPFDQLINFERHFI